MALKIDNSANSLSSRFFNTVDGGRSAGSSLPSSSIVSAKSGEIVEGYVLRALPPRHVCLIIRGEQVIARSQVILNQGDIGLFRVERSSNELVLKLVELKNNNLADPNARLSMPVFRGAPHTLLGDIVRSSLDGLFESLAGAGRLPWRLHWLGKMSDLLQRISLSPENPPTAEMLKAFVDGSGMRWESKLRQFFGAANQLGLADGVSIDRLIDTDLKALAMRFLESNKLEMGEADNSVLMCKVVRFLETLEQLQLFNCNALEHKGKLLLTVPMFWDQQADNLQLLIGLQEENVSEKDAERSAGTLSLSLFLNMSKLGPVRADALVAGKQIRVVFLVSGEDVRTFFLEEEQQLRSGLERHGFFAAHITCRVQDRIVLEHTSLVEDLVEPGRHQINLVV